MNILTDRLPDTAAGYRIHTDYTRWITWERVLRDEDLTDQERLTEMLLLVVEDPQSVKPEDMQELLEALIQFRAGPQGQDEHGTGSRQEIHRDDAYDYDIDQSLILAAFRQAYGIDLTTASMHWWTFQALLQGLPDDTRFMRIVGYRTADTSQMPKETARQYNTLKARYRIKRDRKPLTKEQAEQNMRDQIANIYKRAQNARRGGGQ